MVETRHALIGSRSGAMHRLGDVVDVKLVEAAPVAGALRFELVGNATGEYTDRKSPRKLKGKANNGTKNDTRSGAKNGAKGKAHPGDDNAGFSRSKAGRAKPRKPAKQKQKKSGKGKRK